MDEYNKILAQIVKGAEFIERLPQSDPRYNRAMGKYDRLVVQALTMRRGL